ncbi:MAG TPA: hypothetical protein PLV81_15965 [Spirochaetota bacterium]|nr:hypothetical protein [Spirochaetota bacterium]
MFQRFYTYIFISFCIVTLLCSGCSHTYVIKNVSSINHEEVKGNPRIALVGFYPYTSTLVDKTYSQNYTNYSTFSKQCICIRCNKCTMECEHFLALWFL